MAEHENPTVHQSGNGVTNIVHGKHQGLSTTGDIHGGLSFTSAGGGGIQIGGRVIPGTEGRGASIQIGSLHGEVVIDGKVVDLDSEDGPDRG